MQIFRWIVAAVHTLSSAAWFGAMFYSLTTLHPRARLYFRDDADMEEFIATVSQGARWNVLLAFALMGISGVLLAFLSNWSQAEWYMIAGKSILWLIALLYSFMARGAFGPDESLRCRRSYQRSAPAFARSQSL